MSSVYDNCGKRENTNNGLFRMEKIGFSVTNLCAKYDYLGFCLYRNTVSDVLYIQYNGREKGGLTEMHDPETVLPLTYKRYLEMVEKQN